MSGPSVVYRLFNDLDVLLYVGVTDDLQLRLTQHSDRQAWWPEVAQVSSQAFASRRRALEAEARAIFWESPRYNVLGSTRYSEDWEAAFHAAEDEWLEDRMALEARLEDLTAQVQDQREEIERLRTQVRVASERQASRPIRLRELLLGDAG